MKAKKKNAMTLKCKIFYFVSFSFLIGAFIFLGTRDYKVRELPDNQLFNKEYKNVSVNNSFEILSSSEALTFLERDTGILFLGFPQNKWSAIIAELLDEASKRVQFSPIYYFDFYQERESRHDNYIGIIREIDDYLTEDDKGVLNIYAPSVVAIIKGNVFYYNDDTTFMDRKVDPNDYWTSERREAKILEYVKVLNKLKGELS